MSDVESFISSRLPIGGVAAYSVHLPNGVLVSDCLSKSLYPASAEQVLARVFQGSRALLPSQGQAVHYCWTFEVHLVYAATRPDGVCLQLLVENNRNAQLERVKETLQAFLDLPEV